jgi:pimeloyl-ACP methyl ester carboxylesterase
MTKQVNDSAASRLASAVALLGLLALVACSPVALAPEPAASAAAQSAMPAAPSATPTAQSAAPIAPSAVPIPPEPVLAATAAPTAPAACTGFGGQTLPASSIDLPSGAATLTAATLEAATASTPVFCKVLGTIAPRDPIAQRIHFQINLPASWNNKGLQYGGAGMNGVLVTGLTPLRDAAPGDALPIARGYATWGTDSGHQNSAFAASEPGAFALNNEMLENFAYASYKKVRDVAVQVAQRYYGRAPQRVYYFGGSEGGREGLAMAQRFPADYDGIVSVVPVINWTGLFHAFIRSSTPQFADWLDAGKVPLISRAVAQACDKLDGLEDGVINNYLACQNKVKLFTLRCSSGADEGPVCLSDAELELLRQLHTPTTFKFPLANGLTSYPAWLWGHEDSLDGPSAQSFVRWVSGSAKPTVAANPATAGTHWFYGSNWIRYAILRRANADLQSYKPEDYAPRVQFTSALMDATHPDLSAFFARGGKIIVRENAADRAQSALMGIQYHQAVVARLGEAAVEQSMRLYVSPASTHTGNSRSITAHGTEPAPVPTHADLLDPLDRWVSQGVRPADAIIQSVKAATAPFATQATRLMCRYPHYPHYVGGDVKQASSYGCSVSVP